MIKHNDFDFLKLFVPFLAQKDFRIGNIIQMHYYLLIKLNMLKYFLNLTSYLIHILFKSLFIYMLYSSTMVFIY